MTDQELEELRQRWEADPGSRVFLQLAEEYRRLGRTDDAIGVLETGLERSPNHLSAKVALGRCRLEKQEHGAAATIFEEVLERDPTQLVANRLLVEAYLGQKEPAKAARRLDLYRLLNDGDPAIEELQSRLDEATSEAGSAPAEAREPAADGPAADRLAEVSPPASEDSEEEPFPELGDQLSRRRYLEGLHSEGLFEATAEAPAAVTPPSPAPPAAPAAEPDEGTLFDLLPPVGLSEGREDPLSELIGEEPTPEGSTPDEPVAEAPPAEKAEAEVPVQEPAVEEPPVEEPPAEEPAVEEPPVEDSPVEAPPAEEPTEEEPAIDEPFIEEPPIEEPRAEEPPAEDLATVTLGNLYLHQGHHEKAREVFRTVLRREPDNADARAGLAAAERADEPPQEPSEAAPLTARKLLTGDFQGGDFQGGDFQDRGLSERKIHLLRRYLRRIRREA